jgi:hypothetical protein
MAHLKMLDGLGQRLVERSGCLVGGEVLADDQAASQQFVVRASHAKRELGVSRNRWPPATDREIRIAQRRFLDPLRRPFVESRLMRQRQGRR